MALGIAPKVRRNLFNQPLNLLVREGDRGGVNDPSDPSPARAAMQALQKLLHCASGLNPGRCDGRIPSGLAQVEFSRALLDTA